MRLYSVSMECDGYNLNGVIDVYEECDDENYTSGDGCSKYNFVEEHYLCENEPSECYLHCGSHGYQGETYEVCDDGNTDNGDGCDSGCQVEDGYTCT